MSVLPEPRDLLSMGQIEFELARATMQLPDEVASAMFAALQSEMFRLGAFSFETELAVCPIVAAAKTAGIWVNGNPAAGGAVWGSEDCMSTEVEDFVGWFDLCVEERGLAIAIRFVRAALWQSFEPLVKVGRTIDDRDLRTV